MANKLTISFGIHKGKEPVNVSDSWFLLMYSKGLLSGDLKRYAEERIPSLKIKDQEKLRSKAGVPASRSN